MITSPMLSATMKDVSKITYPVLVTPKLDGIRCLIIDGKPVSRNFKDIPNKHVQKLMQGLPNGLDGELMVEGGFNSVQSAIMSEDGEPDFTYNIFDYVSGSLSEAYVGRLTMLNKLKLPKFCKLILPIQINNTEELDKIESQCISEGFEGIMIRSSGGPYKCGRSTPKEGYLSKLKRFEDSEAKIIGFEERMHNGNEAEKDAFGHTKRSSHKDNLIPANTLGTLLVKDIKTNIEFGLGTGFDDKIRKEIWDNKEKYLGKIVTYQYQKIEKDRPRFPSWKGFRDERDI